MKLELMVVMGKACLDGLGLSLSFLGCCVRHAVILKLSSIKPRAIRRQRGGNSNAWYLHDNLRARFDILKKRGPAWGYQGVIINILYAVVAD